MKLQKSSVYLIARITWLHFTDDKKDTPQDNQDNTCIKEAMSKTRKIIRDYNDNLDDLTYKNGDGRPCERYRDSLLKECQGLIEELKRAKDQLQESRMKDIYPCDCKDISWSSMKNNNKIFHSSTITCIQHALQPMIMKIICSCLLRTVRVIIRTNFHCFAPPLHLNICKHIISIPT